MEEVVVVVQEGCWGSEADIPQASALIGPRLEKLMGSFRC